MIMFSKMRDLEKRVWSLENPSKYNIGEEVDFDLEGYEHMPCEGLIVGVEVRKFRSSAFKGYRYVRYYEVINKYQHKHIVKELFINNSVVTRLV